MTQADQLRDTIEEAVRLGDTPSVVERIKRELSDRIRAGKVKLEPRFYRTRADTYARRLLYRDPELGYTAVVMTWGPGQQTAVHDHAGIWCVEGVVEGEMDVIRYELEREEGGLFRFRAWEAAHASVGSAGCLIPPFEHHVLKNAAASPSITLHVYGGEISRCHVYLPRSDGWYERQVRSLGYDD